MNKWLILGCCCLALTVSAAPPEPRTAAIEAVPFPGGQTPSPLPDNSSWRVTFTYAAADRDGGGSAPLPVALTLTKAAPFSHAVLTDSAGIRREAWADGFGIYLTDPGAPYPYAADRAVFGRTEPWLNSVAVGFPGFEWLAEKNFAGRQQTNGVTLLVFRQGDTTAWIDATTRLPARWQGGGETREFVRLPAPEQPLTLPEDIGNLARQTQLKQQNNYRKAPGGG
jgi:hypothetical protein